MASRTTLPQPGEMIAGKYRVEHTLGSGGMGVVFQVTHRVTGKRFALKWLLPEASARADSAKRFIREAQVAGRFEHPHVVEVYDVGAEGESFYMVMELLDGESLASRVERDGPLSVADTCRLLIPCMRGVAEAHAAGIIHRDLKPANLFVCRATKEMHERAKVLDFGISKMSVLPGELDAAMTKTGVLMGTPYYMPLEQMRGRAVDHRTDIYAFGVVLYQVLSGKLPYQADSFSDLVLLVAEDSPKRLDERVRGLPVGLADVVRKAMAREPEQRYQSLAELVAALGAFAPRSAKEPSPPGLGDSAPADARRPAPVRPGSADRDEPVAGESLAFPTPLSTESKPDLRALPALLAQRRARSIAAASALAVAGGSIAFALLRSDPDDAQLRPRHSTDETSVRPARTPRATASSAHEPSARTTKPSPESAARAADGLPSNPPGGAAAIEGSATPTAATGPIGSGLGPELPPEQGGPQPIGTPSDDDMHELDIIRLGGDHTPSARPRPAKAATPGTAAHAAPSAPRHPPARGSERKAADKKPQSPAKPTTKLPSIDERDFY